MSLALSTYANNFGAFLLSWLVYDLTGSTLAMGILWFSIIVGQLIAQFLIGPYLDRWKRKQVMIVSEVLRLAVFGTLIIMLITGNDNVTFIYAAAFIISIAFFEPAANALIPSIVNPVKLIDANSKVTSIIQITRILGVLSAGLVAFIGANLSIMLIIVFLIASIIMVYMIKEDGKEISNREPWLLQFKKGALIYRKKPLLIYLGVFLAISNFSIFAAQTMYLPFVLENLEGSAFSYGFFAASWPVGYIIGSMILRRLPNYSLTTRLKIMVFSLIVGAVTFILLGFADNIYIAIIIEIVAGMSGPYWNVYSTHLYQIIVPEEIRAQVFSFRILIGRVFAPLGIVFGTTVATVFGIQFMLITVGIISLLVIIVIYMRLLKNKDKHIYV